MAKLKAGLIGCGGRGRSHAMGYLASESAEMVACADVVGATAEQFAEEFGIPSSYEDYQEMLKKEKPDVVSICLWTGLHLDAVLASVEAGVQLINCEKPMAPTWGEARRMHEVCEAAGTRLTFSHQTRYGPTFQKVRDLVREGAIGELIRIEGFCSNLFDLGTHRFDRMFFYNDDQPVEWVMGQVNCANDLTVFGIPVETHGISYVKWKNGVAGLLVTGETSPIQDRLIGSDGMIENSGRDAVRVLRKGCADWEILPAQALEESDGETTLYILDAIAWLEGGEQSLTSSHRALQGTEVIFATYESSRRRSRVYLPLEIEDSPLLSMLENGQIAIPA
jgi:UDP-N-acetylglucosamine 3-dehydrogenase